MRFLIRLLGGIWVATLVVSAIFAYLEVREERERLVEDLQRRAALVGYTVGQAAEGLIARGSSKAGYERVISRFGRPDRPVAVYDAFGSILGATTEVRPFLGPISPLITRLRAVVCSGLAPSSTKAPTRHPPSIIIAGVSNMTTKVRPLTSTPSTSPESTWNASAARQKSFVARRARFDQVHGQIASQEQFSKKVPSILHAMSDLPS